MNQTQRDYVVPAIVGVVALTAIFAGTLIGLAIAKRDDVLVLAGILGSIVVTPALLTLFPLIKQVNRSVAANEATAQGVEQIRHRLNGEFSAEIKQAITDGVAPLRADIDGMRSAVAAINARLKRGDRQFAAINARLDAITSCETKPEETP